jgi:hypothetical protein
MKKYLLALLLCMPHYAAYADQPIYGCAPNYGHTSIVCRQFCCIERRDKCFVAKSTSAVLAYYSAFNYSASTSLTVLVIDGNQPLAGNATLQLRVGVCL